MAILRFTALIVVLVLMAGCIGIPAQLVGSRRLVTRDFDLADFTRIEAGSAFEVTVTQSETYRVRLTVNENVLDQLDVSTAGDTLRIRLQPSLRLTLNNVTLRAEISLPTLEGLNLSGASQTTITGFQSDRALGVDVSGASRLTGDITGGDASFDVSGASTVELEGGGQNLEISASGASTANLEDFAVADATAEASGASRIVVNASGRLNAEASGASTVRYVGEPQNVNTRTSGASSVGPR